jgi:hypothetical protein
MSVTAPAPPLAFVAGAVISPAVTRLLVSRLERAGERLGLSGARRPAGALDRIVVSDAEREVAQPADLAFTHAQAGSLLQIVARHRPRSHAPGGEPQARGRRRGYGDRLRLAAARSQDGMVCGLTKMSPGAGLHRR